MSQGHAAARHPEPGPPGTDVQTVGAPGFAALHALIAERTATVAVVGLGYVGLPLLLAAAAEGFPVLGLDNDGDKVKALRAGRSHVRDVADGDLTANACLRFTSDQRKVRTADVVLVTVPTPLRDGTPDLSYVEQAARQIADVLEPGRLVVLESTTYPGTTEDVVRPILERSGLVAGRDFALAYSPERIDPGSGRSFRRTPKIVGGIGPRDTELAAAFYGTLVDSVVRTTSPRAAEMAKLVENTFRQVNIALVNELATIAPAIDVDIWEALEAAATKPFGYMPFWPGPGVGGHCIAIDPSYLSWKVEQHLGFGIGFVEHARAVNNRMPEYVTARITETLNGVGRALRGARLVVLGLTYKAGVNDVRSSPALNVLERLVAAGAECRYHDPFVPEVSITRRLKGDGPHIARVGLSSSPLDDALLADADCAVILTAHPDIDYAAVVDAAPLVFDAVGVTRGRRVGHVVLL